MVFKAGDKTDEAKEGTFAQVCGVSSDEG